MYDFVMTTGTQRGHVVAVQDCWLTQSTAEALCELQEIAAKQGFQLRIASGYRSFERQLQIWNAKASGQRPVLDRDGLPINIRHLNEEALMYAILSWSALPGASRHHWGTDIDVFDAAAVGPNYQVQLTCAETQDGGVFSAMHRWLDAYLAEPASRFFRPYPPQSYGIASEPWHLSYAAEAALFQRAQSIEKLAEFLRAQPILLKEVVLANIDVIFSRYVAVDWALYPSEVGVKG